MTPLVRPLLESDLDAAEHIFRLAFGTFLRLPDPLQFAGDADPIRTRWKTDPSCAFGAEAGGSLVGSIFLSRWGSVALFGPLTVHPDFWDEGIAQALLHEAMRVFARWRVTHVCLFTYPESPKHIALYQKFGFWPRFLTAIMCTSVQSTTEELGVVRFSDVTRDRRQNILQGCAKLTGALYQGLDLEREIVAVDEHRLGDTLLFFNAERIRGFAVCHCGTGTEAGTGVCYIKFAAVEPEYAAAGGFHELLRSCHTFAALQGLEQVVAGVNTARHQAYALMLAHGYRTFRLGVAMQKPNTSCYNRKDIYIIDDWR